MLSPACHASLIFSPETRFLFAFFQTTVWDMEDTDVKGGLFILEARP